MKEVRWRRKTGSPSLSRFMHKQRVSYTTTEGGLPLNDLKWAWPSNLLGAKIPETPHIWEKTLEDAWGPPLGHRKSQLRWSSGLSATDPLGRRVTSQPIALPASLLPRGKASASDPAVQGWIWNRNISNFPIRWNWDSSKFWTGSHC